jgi:hypothetical protein
MLLNHLHQTGSNGSAWADARAAPLDVEREPTIAFKRHDLALKDRPAPSRH